MPGNPPIRAGKVRAAVALACLMAGAPGLYGQTSSYTGQIVNDDDERVFYVTLTAPGVLTAQTFSYAGGTNAGGALIPRGGFDPTLSVFDSTGNLVGINKNRGCTGSNADAVTGACWDAYLAPSLPAGVYRVILTQSENLPNGPFLSDSFVYAGNHSFTWAPGSAAPGFWDLTENQRLPNYAIDISGGTTVVTSLPPQTPPIGFVGIPYSAALTATTGSGASLTWSVTSGALPPGLTLNANSGLLVGQPTTSGQYTFTVQVTDGIQPVTQQFTVTIYGAVTILTSSLPSTGFGQSYSATMVAANGSGSYSWSATGLPPGLSMTASTGVISGVTTASGSFSVNVTVLDVVTGRNAASGYTIVVTTQSLTITSPSSLGGFVPGNTISGNFTASGGQSPYTWTATNLPAGLNLNGVTGAFSGAATAGGNFNFNVQVSDSQNPPATAVMTISYTVLAFATSALPLGTQGTPYSGSVAATGGTLPYTFSSSNLPAGLSMTSNGAISGTPTVSGTFGFTANVRDNSGLATSTQLSLNIAGGTSSALTLTGGTLPGANVGTAYQYILQPSGGKQPYGFSQVAGVLPPGLTLSTGGILQGSPATSGSYTFSVQVADSSVPAATASGQFTIVVGGPSLSVSLGTFPAGTVGLDYPLQVITSTGGTGPFTYTLTSGVLPPGLTFSGGRAPAAQLQGVPTAAGTYAFTITVTDSNGNSASGNASILVRPGQGDLLISQSIVGFNLSTGANALPTAASVTVKSTIVQQILYYNVTVAPSSATWLSAVSGGTTTPGSVTIALTQAAPALPAQYTQATVNITCVAPSPCAGNVQTVTVNLAVSGLPAQLSLSSPFLSMTASAGSGPMTSTLGIQNTGGGSITVNSVSSSVSWLTISGIPATLLPGPQVNMTVAANPTGLNPGYYTGVITALTSVGTATTNVGLLVSGSTAIYVNTTMPAQFTMQAGGATASQGGTLRVNVTGGQSASYGAAVTTATPWLKIVSAGGFTTANAPGAIVYSIDAATVAALPANTYYGNIEITAPNAVNSPQEFPIVLRVNTQPVQPEPSPAGTFLATLTTASQTVTVGAGSVTPQTYQASTQTSDGGHWLTVSPATGQTSALSPGLSTVSVNAAGLTPGSFYYGTVSYALSAAAVRSVNVTLLVGSASGHSTGGIVPEATCTATSMAVTQIGLLNNFGQYTDGPVPLRVQVTDNCGNAVTGATVQATFSNGDQPLAYTQTGNDGTYSAIWTPRGASPQTAVTSTAIASGLPTANGPVYGVTAPGTAPVLNPGGTLDAFNPVLAAPVAPGSVVQIYGSNFATVPALAGKTPLPTTLNGVTVTIGGYAAPLYYVGLNQINAQVPNELIPGNRYEITVNSNGQLSTPDSVQVVALAPGVANFASGMVIAQHAADYSLITQSSPARPGEYVTLYLSGMGITDIAVPDGFASPGNPPARTLTPATVVVNGEIAPVVFSGLAPTAAGLYQINFMVPTDAMNGNLPLIVSQGTAQGNQVLLPVQQ